MPVAPAAALRSCVACLVVYGGVTLPGVAGPAAYAVSFNHVVALGDSLFDDPDGQRSPVAAYHIADRLDVGLTNLAHSGATSTALIDEGQHTQAAAAFGAGDLALLWIGGNDVFWRSPAITFGGYDNFLDTLEANVDEALTTLRAAEIEVVVLNLPDFAEVPAVRNVVETLVPFSFLEDAALENFTQAARFWNHRLDQLATRHDAVVVDVFSMLDDLSDAPEDYAVLGHTPVLGPAQGCQYCVFADGVHPSAWIQGVIAGGVMEAINDAFDPQGVMPLEPLSTVELAGLAGLLAGDFDESGGVGADDLALWETGFGRQGLLEHGDGEANGDQRVGGSDLLVWQRQHGQSLSALAAATPEPASLLLGCLGTGLLIGRRPAARTAKARRRREAQRSECTVCRDCAACQSAPGPAGAMQA